MQHKMCYTISYLSFHNEIVHDFAKYMQPGHNTLDRISYITGWSENFGEICEANLFVRGDKNSQTKYA